MRHVVFMMASSATPIRPFIELARQFEKEVNVHTVILCEPDIGYRRVVQESQINTEGITFIDLGVASENNMSFSNTAGVMLKDGKEERREVAKFRSSFPFLYKTISPIYRLFLLGFKTICNIKKLKKQKKEVKHLFSSYKPECLILYSDARGGYEAVSIRIAQEYRIPRIVAPIVYLLPADQLLRGPKNGYRVKHDEKMPFLCKRIMQSYPDIWVDTEKEKVFYYSPDMILALSFMKMLPANPWIVGAGNSSLIAMMFQENYDHCLEVMGEDFIRKRVVFTRSIEKTSIRMQFPQRKAVSERLRTKYGIRGEHIVLFAMSAYSESTLSITYEETVSNYRKILEVLVENFDEVLISLHPRMKRENYDIFEDISGCRIIEEPLYSIIVACDVYIGCEISSAKNLIEDFNFPKVLISHEAFLQGIDEVQIHQLRLELQKVRTKQNEYIIMKEDNKADFYKVVLQKLNS